MRTCDIEGCERKHYARGWIFIRRLGAISA
jgi:hypothetical protein